MHGRPARPGRAEGAPPTRETHDHYDLSWPWEREGSMANNTVSELVMGLKLRKNTGKGWSLPYTLCYGLGGSQNEVNGPPLAPT